MAHKYNQKGNLFVVLDDDGYMSLYTKNGDMITKNIWQRVYDHAEDIPYVIAKFTCNIVGTKEEMLSEIERYKNE